MDYTIIENGRSYDLPKYNLKISAKMEQVEAFKTSGASVNEQLKRMYDFCGEILGKENAAEIMGKIDDADPNMINIVYLDIVRSYGRPLEEYEKDRQNEQLNGENIDKMLALLSGLKEASALIPKK